PSDIAVEASIALLSMAGKVEGARAAFPAEVLVEDETPRSCEQLKFDSCWHNCEDGGLRRSVTESFLTKMGGLEKENSFLWSGSQADYCQRRIAASIGTTDATRDGLLRLSEIFQEPRLEYSTAHKLVEEVERTLAESRKDVARSTNARKVRKTKNPR
ncbi:unnamed protein product, partial [Laminaria digitata]